jgi:hypothetical protein
MRTMRPLSGITSGLLAVTINERVREVADLIVEAYRLSDTPELAGVHHLLGLVAIEAVREAPVSLDPVYPPGVVPLRRTRPVLTRAIS